MIALLGIHFALAATSIEHKSGTFDEIAHLTKGYDFWRGDDHRLMPEHPPLAQAWAAIPLLDEGLKFPARDQASWYGSEVYKVGKEFFYALGNDPERMLAQSRRMIVLLSVALGTLVFFWSRMLFGTAGGFVSLGLYALSPTVLAHARLVTTDAAVSLFFLASIGSVWWVLHRVSWASLATCAACLSGLFVSKLSAPLIIPAGLVLLVIRLVGGRPMRVRLGRETTVRKRAGVFLISMGVMALLVLTVWGAIWAVFDFRYEAMVDAEPGRDRFFSPSPPPADKDVWEHQSRGIPRTAAVVDWMRRTRILPESYVYGVLFTVQSARGRDAFLDGERRMTGWWYFFPRCFGYKVPLPIMGIILLAVVSVFRRPASDPGREGEEPRSRRRRLLSRMYDTAPLWVLIAVYWATAIGSHLNIGHRHLLPTFAPMFVLCGAAGARMRAPRLWVRPVVPALLGILFVVTIRTWPDYLAFFNTIAGGPANGYRHLVDSSLDWGQDLGGLRVWLDEHRGRERVYVAYFGTSDVRRAGIRAGLLPYGLTRSGSGNYALEPGLYCISATRLQLIYLLPSSEWTPANEDEYRRYLPEMKDFVESPNDRAARASLLESAGPRFRARFNRFQRLQFGRLCAYLRSREPDDHVGHSILIYRLNADDLNHALNEPFP